MYNYILCYIYYTRTHLQPRWNFIIDLQDSSFGFNPHATTAALDPRSFALKRQKVQRPGSPKDATKKRWWQWEKKTNGEIQGSLNYLFGGDQMYANVWWFWGISPIMVHCLGWFHIMTPEIHGDVLFKLIPIGPIWRLQSEVISGQDLETLNIEMLIMTNGDLDTGNALECGQT